MFRSIKAIRMGQKLALTISIITKESINYLILSGCDIGTRETGYFLLEVNSLVLFCHMIKVNPITDLETGLIFENSNDSVRDWLKKLWTGRFSEPEAEKYSNIAIDDFTKHFQNWTDEFYKENKDLVGQTLEVIRPKAIEKFITNTELLFSNKTCKYEIDKIREIVINNIT